MRYGRRCVSVAGFTAYSISFLFCPPSSARFLRSFLFLSLSSFFLFAVSFSTFIKSNKFFFIVNNSAKWSITIEIILIIQIGFLIFEKINGGAFRISAIKIKENSKKKQAFERFSLFQCFMYCSTSRSEVHFILRIVEFINYISNGILLARAVHVHVLCINLSNCYLYNISSRTLSVNFVYKRSALRYAMQHTFIHKSVFIDVLCVMILCAR